MQSSTTRATIYIDPEIHTALLWKAAQTRRSISELVSEAVLESLREDVEDLTAFAERATEKGVSYEALLKRLKANGTL